MVDRLNRCLQVVPTQLQLARLLISDFFLKKRSECLSSHCKRKKRKGLEKEICLDRRWCMHQSTTNILVLFVGWRCLITRRVWMRWNCWYSKPSFVWMHSCTRFRNQFHYKLVEACKMHINMDIQFNWIFIVFLMKFSLNAYDHGVQTWL